MADIKFLETMNRREKRAVANSLRGVGKCLNCDLLGKCYREQQRILDIQQKHKGGRGTLLPKNARQLPTETCSYHEQRNERGEFYPKYEQK